MENVNTIRKRLNSNRKNRILKYLSIIYGIIAIILGLLIYMKKDENATFLKNNFNIDASFKNANADIDNFLNSFFTFRFGSTNNSQMVNGNVVYLEANDNYFYCEGTLEKDKSYTILVEYNNNLLVAYYQVYDPLVKVYDQVTKVDYLASYNETFKALFKKDGKLIKYSEI